MARPRVGLLGGTFDPPHIGHLVVADEVRVSLGLDQVRLLVAGDPWMKPGRSTAVHRVAMARLAAEEDPFLAVDDRETRRDGPTYTVETLEGLRADEPDHDWFFVIGADAAVDLTSWHRAEELMRLATFVVVARSGHEPVVDHPLLGSAVTVEVPAIGVSSTELRRRFAEGAAVRYLVPPAVERYAREHELYGPRP